MVPTAKPRRRRHIPQRTCVGCRQSVPKRSAIRIVRTSDGVMIDPTGRLPGRGAYLHSDPACWQAGLKGSLARALRVELSSEDRSRLQAYLEQLKEEQTT
ncbi:MAG: YlxR family protein [Anaerolineales bacterium]